MGCIYKTSGLYSRMTVGAVLLAAGAGSRLGGRPKALLELGGVPLVMRQLVALSGAGVDEVAIVLGHHAEAIEAAVREFPITLVRNPSPDDGQASSVRIGLQALSPKLDAVIVALADQPLINEQDITALIGAFKKRGDAAMVVPRVTVARRRSPAGQPGHLRRCAARGMAGRRRRPRMPQVATGEPRARALVRHRQPSLPRRHRYAGRSRALRREHRSHAAMARRRSRGKRPHDPSRRRRSAAPDAGARLRLGAAGRGLGRHRQLRAAVRAVRGPAALRSSPCGCWRSGPPRTWPRVVACGAGRARWRCARPSWAPLRFVVAVHRGGLGAVLLALAGWAALTALASGVVRSLRLAQSACPRRRSPPPAWVLCAPAWLWATPAICRRSRRLATFVVATAPCWCCCSGRSRSGHARRDAAPACSIVRCRPGPRAHGAIRGNGRRCSPDWRCCR